MEQRILTEVLDCLRGERTLIYYYLDQYAVDLLKMVLGAQGEMTIKALRASVWSKLLKRPILSKVVANCGSGCIGKDSLDHVYADTFEPFVLTLGKWGGDRDCSWNQTTRPGGNLVLQLNLSAYWAQKLNRLTDCVANNFFDCGHPLSDTRDMTLAWVRLDVDFETNEVLIEEVQSDLIRRVAFLGARARTVKNHGRSDFFYRGAQINVEKMIAFSAEFDACFGLLWSQAALSSALKFVRSELGISDIYYHTFDAGNILKGIRYGKPPRSLYTDLPKQFCFKKQEQGPKFLSANKRVRKKLNKIDHASWFYMPA